MDLDVLAFGSVFRYLGLMGSPNPIRTRRSLEKLQSSVIQRPRSLYDQKDTLEYLLFRSRGARTRLMKLYALSVTMEYLEAILKRHGTGPESIVSNGRFGAVLLAKAREFREPDPQEAPSDPVEAFLLERIRTRCEGIENLYLVITDSSTRKAKAVESLEVYKEELMARTWHPSRVRWWISEDLREELGL